MQHFQESDLDFTFPGSWAVRKYDDHRFYQALSGYGLKAVDFIVLLPDGRLCLMEVKNYNARRDVQGKLHPVERKKASRLAKSLAKKYSDSLRAIRVINLYYQKKWYHRWRYFLFRSLGRWGYRSDLLFWREAARRAHDEIPTSIVLWLETPDGAKRYRTKIYAHLANLIDPEEAVLLLGGNGFSPLIGLDGGEMG